jgi:hypothetical protein
MRKNGILSDRAGQRKAIHLCSRQVDQRQIIGMMGGGGAQAVEGFAATADGAGAQVEVEQCAV